MLEIIVQCSCDEYNPSFVSPSTFVTSRADKARRTVGTSIPKTTKSVPQLRILHPYHLLENTFGEIYRPSRMPKKAKAKYSQASSSGMCFNNGDLSCEFVEEDSYRG